MSGAPPPQSPSPAVRLGLFLLSAASLAFEINLTRLFSVAQFYHFAFLVVSLALLGFGASGTALAIWPASGRGQTQRTISRLALATSLSIFGAYLISNWLPFDSFSIAWDPRQVVLLTLNLLALASPFFWSGLAVGILLNIYAGSAGSVYAVNLAGSACGCLIALLAPSVLGGEGMIILTCWLAALGSLVCALPYSKDHRPAAAMTALLLAAGLLDTGLRASGHASLRLLDLRWSPYKGLSYALQYPEAEVIYRRWNAFSRVDVVRSAGIRSLPGLSYRYAQLPPPQNGLLVDGDDLSPVVLPGADQAFVEYLPTALAFRLRPEADALILEPRGGLDVLVALASGARRVVAVEENPLIVEAAWSAYADPRAEVAVESGRSFLRGSHDQYDVIVLSLANAYRPVRSGAYSLGEDYRYTVEAFADALSHLSPDGLLVVPRWLQMPPSEELRAFALAVTALEHSQRDPADHIVALRGYTTATMLVRASPFTPEELAAVRAFAAERAFDLIYAPGLRADESNQHNILPEDVYYAAFAALLNTPPRERPAWYAAYDFDITPLTDDRPFFGHFFRWSQVSQTLAELGKTWQPFGGAGYLVVLALLGTTGILAAVLIVLPLAAARLRRADSQVHADRRTALAALTYFGLIGLAFLLIEIPLIQRFILLLDNPAYALSAVLFTLLLFSSLGSLVAQARPIRPWLALTGLAVYALSLAWLLTPFFSAGLGLPLGLRLGLTVAALAPLGVLMGIPFPAGIRWLRSAAPGLIPWVWSVNGAASVVASVLAALLALTFGFRVVLIAGAACYAAAGLMAAALRSRTAPSPPLR